MDDKQINDHIFKNKLLSRFYYGMFYKNNVPHDFPKGMFIIIITVNSFESTRIGHWYLKIKLYNNIIETFDSLLLTQTQTLVRNRSIVQHPQSMVCGYHVLFYVRLRYMGYSAYDIIHKIYTRNLHYNDTIVQMCYGHNKG
jgi:hypothetical protein